MYIWIKDWNLQGYRISPGESSRTRKDKNGLTGAEKNLLEMFPIFMRTEASQLVRAQTSKG